MKKSKKIPNDHVAENPYAIGLAPTEAQPTNMTTLCFETDCRRRKRCNNFPIGQVVCLTLMNLNHWRSLIITQQLHPLLSAPRTERLACSQDSREGVMLGDS